MNNIKITIKKELRSVFRDKKTILTLLVFPLIIPAMIFLYGFMYSSLLDENTIYTIGINYDPDNVEQEIIKASNLDYLNYNTKEELEEAYSNKDIDAYIIKNNSDYQLYTNQSNQDGMMISEFIIEYLDAYQEYLTKSYLVSEGIDLDKAYNNISYEINDIGNSNYLLTLMFSVSITYIIMSIVMTTTNMATSATAVEKENGTLETILTFPISSNELITGKYLSTVIMSIITSTIGLVLTILGLGIASMTFEIFETLNFNLSILSIVISFIVVIAASILISGIGLVLTAFSKTYKEAQSSSQILTFLTIIPMFATILNIPINTMFYFIPIINYTQILMDIFTGNIDLINLGIVFTSSIIYGIIVIKYIISQYSSEKVLFSK